MRDRKLHPYELTPIGTIWASESSQLPTASYTAPYCDRDFTLELEAVYVEGCIGLETGCRLTILYWLSKADRTVLKRKPPDGSAELGVFAMRAKDRPNPVGVGTVLIQSAENNFIHVTGQLACPTRTTLLDLRPRRLDRIESSYVFV